MLDLSKLTPLREKHSVTEAMYILVLPYPIGNASSFEKLLLKGEPLHNHFQRFAWSTGVNVDFRDFNPTVDTESTVMPKISKLEQKGFQMESYIDGKQSFVIRYNPSNNPAIPNMLSFHSLLYDRWDQFYDTFYEYCNVINKHVPGILISGYALGYVDQFKWADIQLPKFSDFFKANSAYIPPLLAESTAQFNFQGNFARNIDNQIIAENYVLGANQIALNNYNIFISHQAATTFMQAFALDDMLSGKDHRKGVNLLHNLNKDFLSQTLVNEICDRIGLNTNSHD